MPHLFLLLRVQRVLSQSRAVFLQLQFLAARLATEDVVEVARLVADEKHHFGFFLALGHAKHSGKGAPQAARSARGRMHYLSGCRTTPKGATVVGPTSSMTVKVRMSGKFAAACPIARATDDLGLHDD